MESFELSPQKSVVYEEEKLAAMLRKINMSEVSECLEFFETFREDLERSGFVQAGSAEAFDILHRDVLCRSESFKKVISVLVDSDPIDIRNEDDGANMCVAAGGKGLRVALQEGFSGKDVNNMVKTVVTFRGEHLEFSETIARDAALWEVKPDTADVAMKGKGMIHSDDIEMVTFRFPASIVPESFLNDDEIDKRLEGKTQFVVRHYIRIKNRARHH
jgi:hypothetical protein